MNEPDAVEIWIQCKVCGKGNKVPGQRKMMARRAVEAAEAKGCKLRPAEGYCPECFNVIGSRLEDDPMWMEGAYN
jgi:hypothetical protein